MTNQGSMHMNPKQNSNRLTTSSQIQQEWLEEETHQSKRLEGSSILGEEEEEANNSSSRQCNFSHIGSNGGIFDQPKQRIHGSSAIEA